MAGTLAFSVVCSRPTHRAGNKEQSTGEIHDPMVDQLFTALFGVPATTAYGVFGATGAPIPLLPNGDIYVNNVISHGRQIAGFAETGITLIDGLKLTLGARYQMDTNNLFYATYVKGFRIGGANVPFPASSLAGCGLTAEPAPYSSDTTQSYELGSKNKLLDKLRLASSVYYVKWNKIQQSIYIPDCGLQYTENLGAAVAKGFDMQAELVLTDSLSLDSAIGYTSARYTASVSNGDPVAPQNVINKGDAIIGESGIPGAPWTATVGVQYGFSVDQHKSFARIDYEWQSQNHWYSPTTDPVTTQYNPYSYNPSSTTFVSLRAGTTIGGWQIQPFIDNLFDSHTTTNFNVSQLDGYNPAGSPAPLARNYSFRPRTFGLTFIYRQ